ncbi:MAG: DUF2934 domain-containing protein [Thiocapsa sp.]|uniref:DUF2934 domain-containing protein n=1 Tax=Thiocapsa sp. TaxID=2024551 RepID=UPI001BCD556B|nr:DUF2934 domain-containing protein [Thiocapsa sp.]QVL48048.1 MAG: DUF2934 domain-containing protein [Thiocapsa sp.]
MHPTQSQAPGAPTMGERRKMVEIAAYFLAEHRGFAPGGADADWRRAEQAIDAMIADGLVGESGHELSGDSVHRAEVSEGIRNALKLGGGLSGGSSPRSERA